MFEAIHWYQPVIQSLFSSLVK